MRSCNIIYKNGNTFVYLFFKNNKQISILDRYIFNDCKYQTYYTRPICSV